jgi:hypothetical protein
MSTNRLCLLSGGSGEGSAVPELRTESAVWI